MNHTGSNLVGRECKRENNEACTFLHPCSATDLKLKTIKKIGDQYKDKNIGWFNEYHFMQVPNLKPKYKALMGNKDGPSSKTAWTCLICCLEQQNLEEFLILANWLWLDIFDY